MNCKTTGLECPMNLAAYFPGCSRDCEHNPYYAQATAEAAEKAAKWAAETAAWDFGLSRTANDPYNGVRVTIHREREDAFGGFSGIVPEKKDAVFVQCPICGAQVTSLTVFEGQELCQSCLEGLAEVQE